MPTPDELAARFETDFADLHAMIDVEPDGPLKDVAEDLAAVAHRALEKLRTRAFRAARLKSGGTPKG